MRPIRLRILPLHTMAARTAGGALMLVVFLLVFYLTLRLFIHGREVTVPSLANLSDSDAAALTRSLGLNLSVENRFYSAGVAPNHVLSQSPLPGSRVRRGWQVRVTESLGGQQVSVPDLTGQTERPAELMLRRLGLELGAVAHVPAPPPAGVVLAQSPPPDSTSLTGPRVSLLISDPISTAAAGSYAMPSINGLTVAQANARLAAIGLHIATATDPTSTVDLSSSGAVVGDPATLPQAAPDSVITSQSPAPGHRVSRADAIRVTAVPHPITTP